jgi:hypothetical protein
VLFGFALVWHVHRGATRSSVLPLALMAFSVLSVVVVTIGRATFLGHEASTSRYSLLGLIGVAGLWLWVVTELPRATRTGFAISVALLMLLGTGSLASYTDGTYQGHAQSVYRQQLISSARQFDRIPDAQLGTINAGDPTVARIVLAYMRAHHLSIFSGQP